MIYIHSAIDIRFKNIQTRHRSEAITPIYLDAPILDPSIHIACHIRPAFCKYNNMYILKTNIFKYEIKIGCNYESFLENDILNLLSEARENYKKYECMTIDAYIEM